MDRELNAVIGFYNCLIIALVIKNNFGSAVFLALSFMFLAVLIGERTKND